MYILFTLKTQMVYMFQNTNQNENWSEKPLSEYATTHTLTI